MGEIKIVQVKHGDSLHSQALNLRNEVLRVPIGRSLFAEDLSKEINDTFFVAVTTATHKSENGTNSNEPELSLPQKVIGNILLTIYTGDSSSNTNRIRQMAVSPDYQGKGVGAMLVQRAEMFSKEDGKNRIYLHGRKNASGFYLKMGYKIISEEFLESGIPHFAMEKVLQ